MCPEVREVDNAVRIEYTHQAHILEIQPLGYHLRADQDICFAAFEVRNDLLVAVLFFGGVQVHALHFGVGQYQFQVVFYLFGTEAHAFECGGATGRAVVRHALVVAAVVAAELAVILVVGEAHGAMPALGYPGAFVAGDKGRVAASVLEQDHLLLALQPFLNGGNELTGEVAVHVFAMLLLPHVD